MEYNYGGSGDYTVVFDGAIGTTLYQWNDVCKKLNEMGVKTFVYNRSGYGYSKYVYYVFFFIKVIMLKSTQQFEGKIRTKDQEMQEVLSMGMTNDFQVAIEEGATMVRVGTGIFGERNYQI